MKPADRLRALRSALGEDQRSFAKRLRVSHGAVGHWESGRTEVPGPILALLEIMEKNITQLKEMKEKK